MGTPGNGSSSKVEDRRGGCHNLLSPVTKGFVVMVVSAAKAPQGAGMSSNTAIIKRGMMLTVKVYGG